MDQERLEAMARLVASARSRRELARRLVIGMLLGVAPALAATAGDAEVGPDGQIFPGCRVSGQRCRKNSNCCTGRCTGAQQCRCLHKGASCMVTVKGGTTLFVHAVCCSNRCSKSDNKCQ
jgi:hypothetical protein